MTQQNFRRTRCCRCNASSQSLLRLPCQDHLCRNCLVKRILSAAEKRNCWVGVKRICRCFFPSFFRMERYYLQEENQSTCIAVPGDGLNYVTEVEIEELETNEDKQLEIQEQESRVVVGVTNSLLYCPLCRNTFKATDANGSRLFVIMQFKSRCKTFLMEAIMKLCFGHDKRSFSYNKRPPSSDLCTRLLSYVTKEGEDAEFIAWTTERDDNSPVVFRSFLLQQLLAFNEEDVCDQLDAHLRAASHLVRSKDNLALIVVSCLEDLWISRLASHPSDQRLMRALMEVVDAPAPSISPEDANPLDLHRLRQVANWRVALSLLASSIASLPDGTQTTDLPPLQDDRRRDQLTYSLLQHQWSRVYFLRCLSRFGGTCAALERLRADQYLAKVFRDELKLIDAQVELPDILLCHSELYRNVRRCLYQAYLTGELNQQRPVMRDADSRVVVLVALIAAYRLRHMKVSCDQQQLDACINLMLGWMTPAAQELYRRLAPLTAAASANHQLALLQIHLAFVLATCQSDFVTFLTQLPNNFNNWLLPGMRHDELFEAFTAQGIGGTRAYICPNGHPYYIANCGQPMVQARCPDCGSAIGGQNHQLVAGNAGYQAADRTQRGFVPVADQNRPEPVRQLSAGGAALLRSLQALAVLLGGAGDGRRFAEEFRAGLALFSRATGRSQEDAAQALHLLLLCGLSAPAPATAFNLATNDGRREFETRMEARLLRPLLDNLSDRLRESSRVVGQDDLGRTSEMVRLVQETSELDRRQAHEGQLWRFRQVISVEHAVQTFRELGADDKKRHALIEAVTRWEFALRHLRALPILLQLVKDLVAAWKLNLAIDRAKQQPLQSVVRKRWEAGVREFLRTWQALRGYLATRGARFLDATFPITLHAHPVEDLRLAALLPHSGVWGRCIVGLVQLLMEAQNSVLEASGVHCDEIDVCQVDAASMISYDPDADLLPTLLANCAYSLRPGKGCQVAYNFAGLQQQLTELLVRGKLRLTGHLPQMLYKEEFNLMERFRLLDQAVPQCRTPSSSAVGHALSSELPTSPPVITSLLEESLPPAVSFLTSLAPKEPSQLLHDFMTKSLRMPQGLPEPLNRCVTIDHVRLLWLTLDRLRCQQLADDGFEPFRGCPGLEAAPLEPPLSRLLPHDLRNRRSLLMEKLHCLMRLELASRPDLLDMPLSEVGTLFTDYEGVFDDWDDRLLCRHAAAVWMAAFALDASRA